MQSNQVPMTQLGATDKVLVIEDFVLHGITLWLVNIISLRVSRKKNYINELFKKNTSQTTINPGVISLNTPHLPYNRKISF